MNVKSTVTTKMYTDHKKKQYTSTVHQPYRTENKNSDKSYFFNSAWKKSTWTIEETLTTILT